MELYGRQLPSTLVVVTEFSAVWTSLKQWSATEHVEGSWEDDSSALATIWNKCVLCLVTHLPPHGEFGHKE